ncbi:MAG: DUF2911 domain-containing protein, partial [Janthinobacterium lividum]
RFEADDLGKVPMTKATIAAPQEVMSIDFEKTTGKRTELHIKWENTDVFVPVTTTVQATYRYDGPPAHYAPLTAKR